MAQDIPLAINKVVYGGETLIDITDTTATSDEVLSGRIFYNADGSRGVGTMVDPTPTILYNNASGSTTTITLNDNINNYSYIEVFYGWDTGAFGILSTRYDLNSGYNLNLSTIVTNNNYLYFGNSTWTASGTTLTLNAGEYWRIRVVAQNCATRTSTNNVAIYKVLGYK